MVQRSIKLERISLKERAMNKQVQKATVGYQSSGNIIINDTDTFIAYVKKSEDNLRAEFNLGQLKTSHQLEKLSEIIVPILTRDENRKAFEQPDYLINVMEAQRSAIRTDSEEDLLLLADILEQRAQINNPTPRHKMATRKALDVVGQLSQGDLDTLTILWYGLQMTPEAVGLEQLLNVLNQHLAPFTKHGIPKNIGWMSDLDILDCINVSNSGLNHLKGFSELFADHKASGYFVEGMTLEESEKAKKLLKSVKLGLENLVIQHPINNERFLLYGGNEEQFRTIVANNVKSTPIRDKKIEEVIQLNKYGSRIGDYKNESAKAMAKYDSLKEIGDWWAENSLPVLSLTPVGIVMAYSNFHKALPGVKCPSLPELLGS